MTQHNNSGKYIRFKTPLHLQGLRSSFLWPLKTEVIGKPPSSFQSSCSLLPLQTAEGTASNSTLLISSIYLSFNSCTTLPLVPSSSLDMNPYMNPIRNSSSSRNNSTTTSVSPVSLTDPPLYLSPLVNINTNHPHNTISPTSTPTSSAVVDTRHTFYTHPRQKTPEHSFLVQSPTQAANSHLYSCPAQEAVINVNQSPVPGPAQDAVLNINESRVAGPAQDAVLNINQSRVPGPAHSQDPDLNQAPIPNTSMSLLPDSTTDPLSLSPTLFLPSPQPFEEPCPDLECAICFSQFNNVFRCPKMLQCKHTFCLECLARINVKSAQPNRIQCPLCRSLTPLPVLGLPKLTTDSDVLSYLPAAMQRVYSIRFNRRKGKLKIKRAPAAHRQWGQRPLASLRSVSHSLDVGLPSPPLPLRAGRRGEETGVSGALLRLTARPACRAFLLTSVVLLMVILTGIVIFLIAFRNF